MAKAKSPVKKVQDKVEKRPAETGAIASAVALLVGRALGIDDVETVTAIAVVIGFVPAAITYAVETFGL